MCNVQLIILLPVWNFGNVVLVSPYGEFGNESSGTENDMQPGC